MIAIIGLPQLSETIYTPSLPELAKALNASANSVEYTLTIYLMGFGVGVLLWGFLSDRIGRRPALLYGMVIYVLGCILCWFSRSIDHLMVGRFIQAFGGSTGSVLGMSIARDSFPTAQRPKIFATMGLAFSLAPALGPIVGGYTAEYFGWIHVFTVLIGAGSLLVMSIWTWLPETNPHLHAQGKKPTLWYGFSKILSDRRVLGLAFLVGGFNGILFSYYAEGPFYFIKMLGMSSSNYGLMCIPIGIVSMLGTFLSRYLNHQKVQGEKIILLGCLTSFVGSLLLTLAVVLGFVSPESGGLLAIPVAFSLALLTLSGMTIAISNCLSNALEDYSHMAGTAASIFGFIYYLIISFHTSVMGTLHNGTALPMPLFFLASSISMVLVLKATVSPVAKVA